MIELFLILVLAKPPQVTLPEKKPSPPVIKKTCPCSAQCTCGCNNGKPCQCNKIPIRDVPSVERYLAPQSLAPATRSVPAANC